MAITLAKATDVLKAYRESGYNASKALPKVGYKESTATKQSKAIINKSIKLVAQDKLNSLVESSFPQVMISPIDFAQLYMMNQEKADSAKTAGAA